MKKYKGPVVALITLCNIPGAFAQNTNESDSTTHQVSLNDVVVSANKMEESRKYVAQQVLVLDNKYISRQNAQSMADLLASDPSIFVQKSQMGGGSPVLRGFEANRVVLMVDGVRMNNIIYRGGHLQNVITLDQSSLERTEILYGPSSTIYGSDALGGVVHFYTKKPKFSTNGKLITGADAYVRYGTVNNEMTAHGAVNLGGKKLASYTSITYSSFGDLKTGMSKNPFYDGEYGERPYYVDRINGKDSMVKNADESVQKQSAYQQYDIVEKLAFRQSDKVLHSLNLQYSNSTDIPRYDRLTETTATGLKYAQWYYGPQARMLAAYDLNISNAAGMDAIHIGANFQDIEESRHNRSLGSSNLSHRTEHVNVAGLNIDGIKTIRTHSIRFGLDGQYNTLKSTADKENIASGAHSKLDTRYPDGDNTMMNVAVYGSHTWKINDYLTLNDGLRLGYVSLHSTFVDTSFFHLPYTTAEQGNLVYSASAGLVHTHSDNMKISLLVSTGFRAPNVDDLSKVFESAGSKLIVPNKDLKPEKTINGELGVTTIFGSNTIWESAVYYTRFYDAIVTSAYAYNGKDSTMYNGTMSRTYANQNQRTAYIFGFNSQVRTTIGKYLSARAGITHTYGRINTDTTAYPLDHIPPFMAKLGVSYNRQKIGADFFVQYNSKKKLADYFLNGEDNEQYATAEGMPAWYTLNLRASYQITNTLTLQAGIDNILDVQYRTFASGINAPGRNIFGTLRFNLQ